MTKIENRVTILEKQVKALLKQNADLTEIVVQQELERIRGKQ